MTQPLDLRVLANYLAPHLEDARVLLIGDLDDSGPLFEAGARLLQVYRVSDQGPALEGPVLVQPLSRGIEVAPGAFDLAIVPNLSALSEAGDWLERARGAVGARGFVVVVAKTGSGGVDYDEWYDRACGAFEHVTVLGKLPFIGTLLAALGEDEIPAVSVDTELAEFGAPTTIVALLSRVPIAFDPYSIIAHPPVDATTKPPPAALAPSAIEAELRAQALQSQLEREREARQSAERRAQQSDEQLQLLMQRDEPAPDLHEELDRALVELASESERAERVDADNLALRGQLQAAKSENVTLRRSFDEANARALRAESEHTQLGARLAQVQAEAAARLERALQSQGADAALQRSLDEANARASRAESEHTALAARLAQVQAEATAQLTQARAEAAAQLAQAQAEAEARLAQVQAEAAAQLAQAQAEAEARLGQVQAEAAAQLAQGRAEAAAQLAQAQTARVDDDSAEELIELERARRTLGRTIAEQREELALRERALQQLLIRQSFGSQPAAAAPELTQKLDRLALELARLQGELLARGWRIQELELALGQEPQADRAEPTPRG